MNVPRSFGGALATALIFVLFVANEAFVDGVVDAIVEDVVVYDFLDDVLGVVVFLLLVRKSLAIKVSFGKCVVATRGSGFGAAASAGHQCTGASVVDMEAIVAKVAAFTFESLAFFAGTIEILFEERVLAIKASTATTSGKPEDVVPAVLLWAIVDAADWFSVIPGEAVRSVSGEGLLGNNLYRGKPAKSSSTSSMFRL